MALARAVEVESEFPYASSNAPFVSASFTPPNNCLLVAEICVLQDGGSGSISSGITISDSVGLTWTRRVHQGSGGPYSCNIAIFTAPVTTGASMTVTGDAGGPAWYTNMIKVSSCTGYDTGTPVGGTAADGSMGPSGSDSITLDATPSSSSIVFASLLANGGTAPTAGTGWTETDNREPQATCLFQSQYRGSSTSTTVGWDSVGSSNNHTTGVAVEIKEAGGGGGGDPVRGLLRGKLIRGGMLSQGLH